jgi:uncharacterized protein
MKRLALVLCLIFSLPHTAHADEASRRAKAKEMITLLHMDRLMTQMMDSIMKQTSTMSKQMAGSNATPADQAKIDEFQHKIFALLDSQLGWKALEPEYITIYANNFTDEELDGIIAFYKSPAGASLVEKLPALTAEGSKISQEKLAIVLPQLKQMIEDYSKTAKAVDKDSPTQ